MIQSVLYFTFKGFMDPSSTGMETEISSFIYI